MIFVVIGLASALLVSGVGSPISIYPFLIPMFVIESRARSFAAALGAGMTLDLVWFSVWPWRTLGLIALSIVCGLLAVKFFNKRQVLTTVILLAGVVAITAIPGYFTGQTESIPHFAFSLIVNEVIAIGLYILYVRWLPRSRDTRL